MSRKIKLTIIGLCLLTLVGHESSSVYAETPVYSFGEAPELRPGLPWLNTRRPVQLKELRGKFVLLNFWKYSSVNCLNVLTDLRELENKYSQELVVLGVHSAKFTAERSTDNLRGAVLRYGVHFPVVNDSQMRIWRDFGVTTWPTMVLIDPEGAILYRLSGPDVAREMDSILQRTLARYGEGIKRKVRKFTPESQRQQILRFPGKVLADEQGGRLFIADSGHQRILITDFSGLILDVIGQGTEGHSDGDFKTAQFSDPQGMVLVGDDLFVADRANHLIRKIDLKRRVVLTWAGTGDRARDRNPTGDFKEIALSSPWDLTWAQEKLFVAMAGTHQIWALDLRDGRVRVHAGSGFENDTDGSLLGSTFAQPSGIVTDGKTLFVADSEGSSVRRVDINRKGEVETIIGHGLLDYGDADGDAIVARLQRPLGVALLGDGRLAVADTYNNKIKLVDLTRKKIATLAGGGAGGWRDGSLSQSLFNEPGGLGYANGNLYVADTNNQQIRVIHLDSKKVSTLALRLEKSAALGEPASPGLSNPSPVKP